MKARLRNFAIETGHTFQEALTYYGLERTIYRLSVSKYAEHFVLKGGIFLYAIFQREYVRTTTDVDLLACRISNGAEEMGTAIATGSACDSMYTILSHVIQAIRVPDEYAYGTIRITLGMDNTVDQMHIIAEQLNHVLDEEKDRWKPQS